MRVRLALGLMAAFAVPARTAWATTAADVCPAAANPCNVTSNITVANASVLDFGTRALVVTHGNSLAVGTNTMTILAGSLVIQPGGSITANGINGNFGGNITIKTIGDITVQAAGTANGRIDLSGDGGGGFATISAGGAFVLDGVANAQSTNSANDGGEIDVQTGTTLTVNGTFNVSGGNLGAGGTISFEGEGGVSVPGTLDASGGDFDGGEIDIDSQNADVSVGPMSIDGAATGSGGLVSITAQGNITLNALITGAGAGSGGNGGDGGEVDAIAIGTTKILAPISLPSGDGGFGGTLDLEAGTAGDLIIGAALKVNGIGTSSCGGTVTYVAGQNMTFGALDASGGIGCGGTVFAQAANGTATISGGTIDVQNGAGSFQFEAPQIAVNAGTDINADGGQGTIQLTGCQLTVAAGAKLESTGTGSSNLLQASGQMSITGSVVSGGTNRFEYLSTPPTVTGTVTPAATVVQNPSLVPCRVTVCGNGTLDPGEQCDDGANNGMNKACLRTCEWNVCGDGQICSDPNTCGKEGPTVLEQCDDGALNGTPGDPCDATCHLITVGGLLFLPGTPAADEGCYLEYGIRNPKGAVTKGFPARTQSCIDGDPACDSDHANDGKCTFQVEICMHETDARLPVCQLFGIASVNLHRPDPLAPPSAIDGANATSLLTALESHPVEVLSGTTVVRAGNPNFDVGACSPLVPLVVPHAPGRMGRKSFSLSATDILGREMRSNHVKLECNPNPAICGNGKVELGEQCDDGPSNGQSTSCCSSTCQFKPAGTACGDGADLCTKDVCAGTADTCMQSIGPSPGCVTPTVANGASLVLRTVRSGKHQAQMKWGKGPAVALGDFGNPTGGELTRLCVYEPTGPGTYGLALQGSPAVSGAGMWTGSATGWKFKSTTGAPDGITGVTLKAGAALKGKVQVTAKGNPPFPAGLPLTPSVVAQFKTSAGKCFGATFSTPTVNTATEFKGKSD
jgi:hypothetical protein